MTLYISKRQQEISHNMRRNNQNNYNNTNKKQQQQQEPKFVIKNENFPELLPKSSLKVEKLPLNSVTKAETTTTTTTQITKILNTIQSGFVSEEIPNGFLEPKPLTKPKNERNKDERTKVIDAIMQNWDRYRDQFESVYGEGVYDDIYSSPPIYFEEPEQGTDDESQEEDQDMDEYDA